MTRDATDQPAGGYRFVPALDVGGTHATAAEVDIRTWRVVGPRRRVAVDGAADSGTILDALAGAAGTTRPADTGGAWGVAMPDPFDYDTGVGRFHGVGKFESLSGVDVGAGLRRRITGATDVVFVNDADAFALGEWVAGAATGSGRAVGITLGTGVGSGWVADGAVVVPDSPPGGRAHRLRVDGVELEALMSRRAIRAAYTGATGDGSADVREIADRARGGDRTAALVLHDAARALGRALAVPIAEFGADVVVTGGSIAGSWDLLAPGFAWGAAGTRLPPVVTSADTEAAALTGAAYHCMRRTERGSG